ncbi:MAG: hypothetical protein S4CHLAM81_03420 [Chlamydiales bacterium]|nr:hypothetical protein [Chlamydiales bacterium]MCH9635132.1 hypothetical protein [Chlamydiales bacterium]
MSFMDDSFDCLAWHGGAVGQHDGAWVCDAVASGLGVVSEEGADFASFSILSFYADILAIEA